ncbi:MAG: DUF2085 domain-containing protein [Acidobacteriia bacterium]|nr:DUF2085 domain-containing protein [Terriglobia bacterium]
MTDRKKLFTVYFLLLAAAVLWNVAIVGAPWAAARGYRTVAAWLYLLFSPLCHQRPERSFLVFNQPFGVCNRCTGIYSGALLGMVLFAVWGKSLRQGIDRDERVQTPRRVYLFVALALMAADVGSELLGIRSTTPWSRYLTGAICGIVAPFYLLPSFFDLFLPNPEKNKFRSVVNQMVDRI